ncbi:MAG TPA: class 1 fructose-bisphosphatase [Candidatus Woesebacteria bacterium]|nr:class 1 fructose-bisphosphatase [Candidatus Woesebacteria bacterium]HPR99384.1 class 1 fructose-bisphosphatase [Candidatus Woesebacteria bacterium]
MSVEAPIYNNKYLLPVNIQEHLRREERLHPEATGALTSILADLSRVAKSVSYLVNTAGLSDLYGLTGRVNIQGESVIKLDESANERFKQILKSNPNVAGYASEEEDTFVPFNKDNRGKYIVWFDPLDGSSNFDTNVSIGSIFSIYKRKSPESQLVENDDFLQKGVEQVCAGYFLYGTSTMFVYTTGHGVFGFTLDPSVGEFVLPNSYSEIKTPENGKIYSVNEANINKWEPRVVDYINHLKTRSENTCTARYVGSLVADFHRNLLKGGVYLYPRDSKNPNGKLRLNCELNPLAFIAEEAGGMATDGQNRLREIEPRELHQRNQAVIGSKNEVLLFSQYLGKSEK